MSSGLVESTPRRVKRTNAAEFRPSFGDYAFTSARGGGLFFVEATLELQERLLHQKMEG